MTARTAYESGPEPVPISLQWAKDTPCVLREQFR